MAAYVVCNTTLSELKKEKKQKTFFFVMHPWESLQLTDRLKSGTVDQVFGLETEGGSMSFESVSWMMERSKTKGEQRCILFYIAKHADKYGIAWADIEAIARLEIALSDS